MWVAPMASSKNPTLQALDLRKQFAQIMTDVFSAQRITLKVDANDLIMGTTFAREISSNDSAISKAVIDHMFPHELAGEFHHYTRPEGFESILNEGALRLYTLDKWSGFTAGEIVTFAKKYGLKGVFQTIDGKQYLRTLAEDLFYLSLTRPDGKNEAFMWDSFASQGKGARLRLRIRLDNKHFPSGELRTVRYESQPRNLLEEMNRALSAKGFVPFMPWSISRAAAFYLRDELTIEDEVRLLYKYFPGNGDLRTSSGKYAYWPLPLKQTSNVASVELVSVAFGARADSNVLRAALAKSQFNDLKIE